MKRHDVLLAAAIVSCGLMLAQGCASGQKTTTVTTVTRANGAAVTTDDVNGDTSVDPPPNQSGAVTTTTSTTQSNEPDSVLGATAHAIGTIILLPFRVVGDILGAIV